MRNFLRDIHGIATMLMACCTMAYAQDETDFATLLARGKENLIRSERNGSDPEADTAAVREGYRRAVAALESAVALNDTSQEAHYFLGYAYDRYLSPFSSGDHLRETPLDVTEKVSREMERVIAISPLYKGPFVTLDPYAKIGSEWGAFAVAMASAGRLDSARWALLEGRRRGGFPDITLELAHNLLASCDTDAILFVNGDNDTFPLWYLQTVEGYRRDITVVNLSLTNAAWYVEGLRTAYTFGLNPLPLTLADPQLDTLAPRVITTKTMATLDVPKETMKAFGVAGGAPRGRTIGFEIIGHQYGEDGRIVFPQDEVVLDVLRANAWRRPVNFSATISGDDAPGLDISDYLRVDGITYRMTPHKFGDGSRVSLPFNNTLLFDSSRFQWRVLQSGDPIYSADAYSWAQNYLWSFLATAEGYRQARRPEMVAKTLARMESLLPFDRFLGLYERMLSSFDPLYKYAGMTKRYQELEKSFK
jgi:hypothetical protein